MKIIKTSNFLKKQAQFNNNLPGDPGLPPGVTDQMISEQFDGPESSDYSNQSGEFSTNVDWTRETTDLINTGYDVQGLPQQGVGNIIIYYEYNAEILGEEVRINDLKMLDIKVQMGSQYQALTVSSPETKQGIFEGLQDEIVRQEKDIITEQHEGGRDYGPDTSREMY